MLCTRFTALRCARLYARTLTTTTTSAEVTSEPFADIDLSRELSAADVPENFNFTRDVIDRWAKIQMQEELLTPPTEGVIDKRHLALWWCSDIRKDFQAKWTFKDLSKITNRTAYALTSPLDMNKGDVILCMMPMLPQYWTVQLACIKTGIIFAPSTFKSKEAMRYSMQLAKPKMIIVAEFLIDAIDSPAIVEYQHPTVNGSTDSGQIIDECPSIVQKVFIPARRSTFRKIGWYNFADVYHQCPGTYDQEVETKSDDVMNLYFTSGAEQEPKLVPHTHASYGIGHLVTGKYFLNLTREDLHWNMIRDSGWAKVSWSSVFGPWSRGAGVYARQSQSFNASKCLNILEELPITTLCGSPSDYRMFLREENLQGRKFHSLRHCVSGGDILNHDIIDTWKDGTGLTIRDGYGQTETTVMCANYDNSAIKNGSMGKPLPGYDIQIIDNEENIIDAGTIGNIAVSLKPHPPVGLFSGYNDNMKQTNAVFSENYYKTGDQGYKDDEGYIYFISRESDMIYIDGCSINPYIVETALLSHSCVLECAAVSTPDYLHLQGQLIKAFVVVSQHYGNMSEDDLLTLLREHADDSLQVSHRPTQYVFIKEIPKTANGKVKRSILRNQEWH